MYYRLDKCPVCQSDQFKNLMICKDHSVSAESFALVQCKKCQFVFTNPRPEDEQLGKYYKSDQYISHQNKANSPINFIYKLVRSKTLSDKQKLIASYGDQERLLDVGCGTGHFLSYCKKKGWDISGVELDDTARSIAEEQTGQSIAKSLDDIPRNPKYNIITLWHVLEHITNLNETIEKLRKLLKKTGRLIIAVPNMNSWDAQHYKEDWAAYDVPRHLYHFTYDTLKTLLKNHNLKIESTRPMPFDAYYVSMLSEQYKNGSSNYIKAIKNGYASNKWAANNDDNYSSRIYIIKK